MLSELKPYAIENCELHHQARLFLVLAKAALACCRGDGGVEKKHARLFRRVSSFLEDAADRFWKAEEYVGLRECFYLKAFVHDKLSEVHPVVLCVCVLVCVCVCVCVCVNIQTRIRNLCARVRVCGGLVKGDWAH